MQGKITKRAVDSLAEGGVLWDTELQGFVARRLASGRISYGLKYTDSRTGRQRWLALGLHGTVTAEQARTKAQVERGRIAAGTDPQAEKEAERVRRVGIVSLNDLLDAHLRLYVEARKLRSAKQIARAFDRCVRPVIGKVAVRDLKRSHVVALLDRIASNNGPVMADRVLAYLRKALNWHAARDDEFVVPIVRGMAQTRPRERARDRTLSDDELRALWSATDAATAGPFGALVRVLLLTAQRRQEVAGMRRSEIEGADWTVPADRAKNNRPNEIMLSPTAFSLIYRLPAFGDFVFGQTGSSPFSGFTKCKTALDHRMQDLLAQSEPQRSLKPWVLHDLRRTARSLMSRAGVRPEIAERVLNHVIAGVQGVYDRYDYAAEKREALLALEALVLRIVEPAANVVDLATHRSELQLPALNRRIV
jgi:integrase